MELDSHLLGLNIAAEQQHSIISHWESRNNRVYGKTRDSNTRRPDTDYQVDEADDVGKQSYKVIYTNYCVDLQISLTINQHPIAFYSMLFPLRMLILKIILASEH